MFGVSCDTDSKLAHNFAVQIINVDVNAYRNISE